jgi:integrase
LLRASHRNPAFRRVLLALRRTGCRPKELRNLTWDQVDLNEGFWIIPKHKTVSMQRVPRPRIIPLAPDIWRLCRWLAKRAVTGSSHVFVNMFKRPYSKDRFVKLLDQMRRDAKLEVKAGERIVLYSNRHTFGTEATGKVTDIELAELMGHTNTRTTQRYVHLNASRLRQIQQKIQR